MPLFKLEMGLPGNSFAFEMARKTGLPESIVKDAEERAGQEYVGIERNLRRIARGRKTLDEKIKKVKHTEGELASVTEEYQKELLRLQEERKGILEAAHKEAEAIVKGAGSQVERTIREIRESQADKERTQAARAELQGFLGAIAEKKTKDEYIERKIEKISRKAGRRKALAGGSAGAGSTAAPEGAVPVVRKEEPLKVGEKVRVKESGLVGEVAKIARGSVTVVIGSLHSTMSAAALERISAGEYKAAAPRPFAPVSRRDPAIAARKLNFKPELDVRGERLGDALDIVMHYVDDAIMVDVPTVRIIHGKGTGALHEEIQKYLRTVPGVASVADADVRNGGSGVTVVTFE